MLEKGKVAIPLNNGFYLASFYLGAGATFFGEEGNEREAGIVLDNDETLAMTNALIDMVQNENLVVSSPEDAIAMMREGNVNAYFCGTWQAAQTEEILGDNFGVAPLPSMTVDGRKAYRWRCTNIAHRKVCDSKNQCHRADLFRQCKIAEWNLNTKEA